MRRLLLLLSLVVAAAAAAATQPPPPLNATAAPLRMVLVRFRDPLNTAALVRIERALGYEVSQLYYPPDSLLLLLDAPRELALRAAADVRSVRGRAAVDVVAAPAVVARAAAAALPAAQPPPALTMRVTMHPGAAVMHGASWAALQTRVAEAAARGNARHRRGAATGAADAASAFASTLRVHNVAHDDFADAAEALADAAHDLVAFIEPVHPVTTTNVWGARSAQRYARAGRGGGGGVGVDTSSASSADTCANVNCAPLWNAGFTGAGQLIGVSDTGITPASCGLADSAHSVPVSTSRACGGASVAADTGHAKIRSLWWGTLGDLVDADGHGEHVVTTALGACVSARLRALTHAQEDGCPRACWARACRAGQ